MPEINQYGFTHRELLELLIKKADLHEGKWVLNVNFGFQAANMGATPETISPGAIIAINNIGIQRARPDSPPALTADAAEINPAST